MTQPFVYKLTNQAVLEAQSDFDSLAQPNSNEILVETLVTAISPGTELAAWSGVEPLRPVARIYPRLMGYCNVGRIVRLGSNVKRFALNDLVLTQSAHRSHALISSDQVLCKVPQDADLAEVATTYLFHLGYLACLKAGVTMGYRVAIVGLGTLGMTASALAHLAGAQVTGFSNHLSADIDPALWGMSRTSDKTDPEPQYLDSFDCVISTTNPWSDWKLALRLVRRGGTIVTMGFPGRGQVLPNFNPLESQYLYDKQLTITSCGHAPNLDVASIDVRFTLNRNCEFLMQAIIDGSLPAGDLIEEMRPAADLAQIYADLIAQRRSGRTFVLDWQKGKT